MTRFHILAGDSRATEAVRVACKEVGSISDIIFEMRFNPSVFSQGTARNKIPHKVLSWARTQYGIRLVYFV